MKKHIVCLGDSNTHGYCADPNDCAEGGIRFNESERYYFEVNEEGEIIVVVGWYNKFRPAVWIK